MSELTRLRRLAATITAAAATTAAVLLGAGDASAQTVTDPVSYEVGDVLVYASVTRNPSCSVTRGIVNNGDVPLRVLASAFTDTHLEHIQPNQGSFDGDAVLQPGQRVTAVWTNHDYLPDTAAWLAWSVMLDVDVDQIGATHLEAVPACQPSTTDTPDTTPPSVPDEPPTDTVVPPATSTPTGPPPSTSVVSVPVEPTPTVPGPETTTTTTLCTADCGDAGVLTSSTRRTELAATGATAGQLRTAGLAFMAIGLGVLASYGPRLRRKVDAHRQDGAR